MQIDSGIVYIGLSTLVGIQGWTLLEIVNLKTNVALLQARPNCPCESKAMKTVKTSLALLFLATVSFIIAGCTSIDRALLEPGPPEVELREVITPVPQVHEVIEFAMDETGEVVPLTSTRTNFVLVTNTAPAVVTNLVVSPGITAGLELAGAAAAVSPWAPVVTPALGAISALLGLYAAGRNRKYQEAAAALGAVVRGVERATVALGDDGRTVKRVINNEAQASGVQPFLHKAVLAQT